MLLPGTWAKVPGKALDATQAVELAPEAMAFAKEGQPPKALFDALMAKEMTVDALKFVCGALPRREAIWWGLICARTAAPNEPPQVQALAAVEKWVVQPTEAHRRGCEKAAQVAGNEKPGGLLASAVFFAEGSIAPADSKHEVPAPAQTSARLLCAAVVLSAIPGELEQTFERMKKFAVTANDVANGTNRWKEAPR